MNPSRPPEGGLIHSFSRDASVVSAATTFLCCEGVFFEPAPTCSLCLRSSRLGFPCVLCIFSSFQLTIRIYSTSIASVHL